MPIASYTIPNLVQGISHQAPEERAATQCEDQQNCINSPKDGVVARGSTDVIEGITVDFSDAAFYEIFRGGVTEHYLVAIHAGNSIRVFNLGSGVECAVSIVGSPAAYLNCGPSFTTRKGFRFQTVDDYTFILNRAITMAMTSDVVAARPKEALVFVKAGGYLQTYSLAITYQGIVYTWNYVTPDNSTAGNAAYISTAQIAATFYQALMGTGAPVPSSGVTTAPVDYQGALALYPGDISVGVVTAPVTAASLGFSVEIRGNVLRIWRASDNNDFQIDSADSVGNTYMGAIKGATTDISQLPDKAFVGFRVQVVGASNGADEDFYLEFTSDDVWVETIGPGEHTTLDATTMPHALVNTGLNTFTFGAVTWETRIVGDSVVAPLPYFIGKTGEDIFFFNGRLGVLNETAYDLGKTRNVFTWFPDTVQTDLATAPINIPVQGARSISLGRRAVLVDESLFIWAQEAQFRQDSGAQPFQVDQVNNKLNSAYTFAEDCEPYASGSQLYFGTDPGDWSAVNSLTYSGGRAQPALNLSAHVPDLIPSGIHSILANDAIGVLFAATDGDLPALYLYNNFVQGANLTQTAWNRWVFPGNVVWASITTNILYMGIQRGSQFVLVQLNLTPTALDAGGNYQTRLDMRHNESQVAMSYSATTKQTTMTLPIVLSDAEAMDTVVVVRSGASRGVMPKLVSVAGSTVVADGDLTASQFFVGILIDAWMDLSEFYPRITTALSSTAGQAAMYDTLVVKELLVSHYQTIAYEAIRTKQDGTTETVRYSSRQAGNAGAQSQFGPPVPGKGKLRVPVETRSDEYTLRLRNKTPWPSKWQRIRVTYSYVNRGAPDANA